MSSTKLGQVKYLFAILGILFLIFALVLNKSEINIKQSKKTKLNPLTATSTKKIIDYQNKKYQYAFFKVNSFNNLTLIFNQDEIESSELIQENNCQYLINGGFYTPEIKPVGWLQIKTKVYQNFVQDNFLNGTLIINKDNVYIQKNEFIENTSADIGLQNGPILIYNGYLEKLAIKDDKFSRRMVAFTTKNQELFFMTIYIKEDFFSGPLLSDLPEILNLVNTREKFEIVNALNLDGGSASVFKNKDLYLNEFRTVGELFCIK